MKRRLSLGGAVCVTLLMASAMAKAGDRPLEVVFVNMSQAGDAERACMRYLRGPMQADYTEMRPMREADARGRLGVPSGSEEDWFTVEDARIVGGFDPLRRSGTLTFDTVALIECLPAQNEVRTVLYTSSGRVHRFHHRELTMDAALGRAIGKLYARVAWDGFSP